MVQDVQTGLCDMIVHLLLMFQYCKAKQSKATEGTDEEASKIPGEYDCCFML